MKNLFIGHWAWAKFNAWFTCYVTLPNGNVQIVLD